jgi:predicted AAA+ superfamily ATPase
MFIRQIHTQLEHWSQRPGRKPLVIRGARQVGKTTVVNNFGKGFQQYIYLNLEIEADQRIFNTSNDIHELVQSIFLLKNYKLAERQNTLLFIDEIQAFPGAFNMLRYFYEAYPELRVIAAGSLLESIFRRGLSFPVGRVEFLVIRPVTFSEFLEAMQETEVLKQLEHLPVNDFAHIRLLQLFHTYALIGGMPEVVNEYATNKDLTALSGIYDRLIISYIDDVEKYARNSHLQQVISHCIRVCFAEAGQRIKFQNFGNSGYSSKEVGEALRTLEKTFLLSLLYPSSDTKVPILPDLKKSPRLQVLDTGLMNYVLGIQTEIIGSDDLNKVHKGTIIEHLVGQELLAGQYNALSSLNFWAREKKSSTAELDFIYLFESKLIPIEVKSGKDGALKSLHKYMDDAPHDMAVRFYAGKFQLIGTTTPAGKRYRLLNLPYYLASQTEKYIAWMNSQPPISPR